MENQVVKPQVEETEISFYKIFSRLKTIWKLLLRKWWLILIATLLGGSIGWLYCFIEGPVYVANCAFTVQGESASSSLLSSALSLASSLGISSKGASKSSYDNLFFSNLIQSRRIIKETYLKEVVINGKKDLLANFYIKVNKLDEDWKGNNRLDGFRFKHNDINAVTRLEDSVLNHIYDLTLDENLLVKYDDSQPFNIVTFTSVDYDFSRIMMKQLLNNTSSFYLREMYALNNNNLYSAQKRVDSLANAIRQLDTKVARLKDNTTSTIKQSGLVDLNSAIRDQGLLGVQYSAAVNNFELAKVSLSTETPVLDIIDDPLFSTETVNQHVILITLGCAIAFFVVTVGGLMFYGFVKDTIEKEKKSSEFVS